MSEAITDEFLDTVQDYLGGHLRSLNCYDGEGQQHDMTPEVRDQYDEEKIREGLKRQKKLYEDIRDSERAYVHGPAEFALIGYSDGLELILMPENEDLEAVQIGIEKNPFEGSEMDLFVSRCLENLS